MAYKMPYTSPMRVKSYRYGILLIIWIFLLLVLSYPNSSYAKSLTLWVMPNEGADYGLRLTLNELDEFFREMANKGIVIDNEPKGLLQTGQPDWMSMFGYNVIGQKELFRQLEDFVESNPDIDSIHVEFLRWTDAYHRFSSLSGDVPPDRQPDIIQMGSTWTAAFAKKGILGPLDLSNSDGDFFPAALSSCSIEGSDTMYAVPWFVDTRLIYYWKGYFPGGESSFVSWENFRESLSQVRGAVPFAMPIGVTWNLIHNLAPWIWGAGGNFIETTSIPGLYRAPWNEREFKDAIKQLHDLSTNNLLELPNQSIEKTENEFLDGKFASILSVSHIVSRMPKNWQNVIGIALPPAGPYGSHPFLGGSHLAITKFAEQKGTVDASLGLIRHLTNPENQLRYSRSTGFLPASQKAMDFTLSNQPELMAFKSALISGRSYPSIPEWGDIFENDTARSHLFNLWNDIALGMQFSVVAATLSDISSYINGRLRQLAFARYGLPALLIFLFGMGGLFVIICVGRKREDHLRKQLKFYTEQSRQLEGQRDVLEGKVLLLEKVGGIQNGELAGSKQKLFELNGHIEALNKKLEQTRAKQAFREQKLMPHFNVSWDGVITAEGREIKFENARQARRLIEYLVRNANYEKVAIHCIRGFILFDWNDIQTTSNPKRLFDTVVTKINSPIRQAGLPPLLRSGGRGSWSWSLSWDIALLRRNNDMHRARERAEGAHRYLHEGNVSRGIDEVIEALKLDPKCTEAYMVLQEYKWRTLPLLPAQVLMIKRYSKDGHRTFCESFNRAMNGIASVKKIYREFRKIGIQQVCRKVAD